MFMRSSCLSMRTRSGRTPFLLTLDKMTSSKPVVGQCLHVPWPYISRGSLTQWRHSNRRQWDPFLPKQHVKHAKQLLWQPAFILFVYYSHFILFASALKRGSQRKHQRRRKYTLWVIYPTNSIWGLYCPMTSQSIRYLYQVEDIWFHFALMFYSN